MNHICAEAGFKCLWRNTRQLLRQAGRHRRYSPDADLSEAIGLDIRARGASLRRNVVSICKRPARRYRRDGYTVPRWWFSRRRTLITASLIRWCC